MGHPDIMLTPLEDGRLRLEVPEEWTTLTVAGAQALCAELVAWIASQDPREEVSPLDPFLRIDRGDGRQRPVPVVAMTDAQLDGQDALMAAHVATAWSWCTTFVRWIRPRLHEPV